MSNSRILNHPELKSLRRVIDRIVRTESLHTADLTDGGLISFTEDLEAFAQSSEPSVLLHEMLSQLESGGLNLEARGNTVILAESKCFVLTISAFEDRRTQQSTVLDNDNGDLISSHPSSSIIVNLGTDPINMSLYSIPQAWMSGAVERTSRLEGTPAETSIAPGKALYLDARASIPDIHYSRGVTLVTRVSSKRYQPMACSFSRSSREFRMFSCTVPAIARVPLAMKMLSAMTTDDDALGHVESEERTLSTLEQYASHALHFFRWSALQSLAAIDLDRARPLLLAATKDDHPHVRQAAIRSVQMLGWSV